MKKMWQRILSLPQGLWTIIKGLWVTFVNLCRARPILPFPAKKKEWQWSKITRSGVTVQYPLERWEVFPRFRGLIRLRVNPETGEERCIACGICASICPARCIKVEGEKRKARKFEINISLCMFCGLCVENCPTAALVMTSEYELSTYDKAPLIYDKSKLLIGK